MRLHITARHFHISDTTKNEIESEMEHLKKFAPHLEKTNVIIEKNKNGFRVELEGKLKHDSLHAHYENSDLGKAFTVALDKLKTQLKRYEDKHYHEKRK